MHRWFFADEHIIRKETIPPPPTSPSPPQTPSSSSLPDTIWTFNVKLSSKLCANEIVAVCGSADILGKWNIQRCLILNNVGDSSLWTAKVYLPRKYDVRYRYLICAISGCDRQRIVRFLEAHKWPRIIRPQDEQDSWSYDIFGTRKGVHKIERGWVSGDATVVQFKFYRSPFVYKKKMLKHPLLMYVKITPLKIKTREKDLDRKLNSTEFQVSAREGDTVQDLRTTFAFCEVASLNEQQSKLHYQPKYGTSCGPEEMVMFHLTLGDVDNTAYLIDLYYYPPKPAADIPPYHFGYQYVMPQQLKGSEGTLNLNIVCSTQHRPIGAMKCDYLLVKPLPLSDDYLKLQETYNYPLKENTLDIGHRGCGKSFWLSDNILRENTLNSFNTALEHGADMLEFDIHLTKDMIPIIYHDYQLYIARKLNVDNKEYDIFKMSMDAEEISYLKPYERVLSSGLISLPLSRFTLKQLKCIQVYEISQNSTRAAPCTPNSKLNLPFPTLTHVLKNISPKTGFTINIKWSQKRTNGAWEENFAPDMDKNVYIDTILNVVLANGGSRRIIFSSLDADTCTMLRLKQNRYPVMFICHAAALEPKFLDPRGDSLLIGSYFAYAMELLGIIADAGDILNSPGQIVNMRERNIAIFGWGLETRFEKCRKSLKALGIHGVIFDRVNHILAVADLKQNLVIIELRENVREIPSICGGRKATGV